MSHKNIKITEEDSARFEKLFERSENCWEWQAYRNRDGYGTFKLHGDTKLAHRVAWMIFCGGLLDGVQVLHMCDNPACVRPEHLILGDHRLNMLHMRLRGRSAKGERQAKTTLTAEQVVSIRKDYVFGNITQVALAIQFGVCQSTVSHIVNRKFWSHV